jgi:predicted FMN-binding regulatory protein PaiB
MQKTLLQKAQEQSTRPYKLKAKPTEDDLELALAWVNDEISLAQVSRAYDIPQNQVNNTYIKLARALKAHLKEEI